MAFKTLATITAATNVQAGDLIGTWRSAGPMTAATVTMLVTYLNSGAVLSVFPTKANNLSDLASAATARTNLGLGTAALLNAGTSANNLAQFDGSAKITSLAGLLAAIPDVIVQDQRTSGASGDSITSGLSGFFDRTLNTTVRNAGSIASLAANAVTLPAGTYFARAYSMVTPSNAAAGLRLQLWNSTDSADLGQGVNIAGTVAGLQMGVVFTLAGSKAVKLRQYVVNALTITGTPPVSTGGAEIYTTLEIWKVA